jgi:hypothetical protein
MGLKPNKVNSVTIPADMLEKIAATNHLAIADVSRASAFGRGMDGDFGTFARARARLDLPMKTGRYLARTRIATGSKIRFLCCFSRAWRDLRESGHRPLRNSPPLPLTRAREGLSESVQGNTLVRTGPVAVYRDLAES